MEQAERVPRARGWISADVFALYVVIHVLALGVFWTGVTWKLVALAAGSFFLRMFGLGVGYHRYFAHRSFKTSRPFQFLLALLGTLSFQRGVIWWAQTHRYHHRNADTPEDIHSPRYQGFLYSHSGWFMNKAHGETDLAKIPDLAKFPELVWLNDFKFYVIPMMLYGLAIYWIGGWPGFIWGFCLSTVLLWHLTHWIQSMSHTYGGYRRYESADNSRNHLLIGLLGLGEWHNNHHHMPSSAKQGHVWWEIDIGWYTLKTLSLLGVVWDLKTPPRRGPGRMANDEGEPAHVSAPAE